MGTLELQLPLLVSLPRNDVRLAEAAHEGGADGLKVHANVGHRASGTSFGSIEEERKRIEGILAVGLPTGIVPGEPGRVQRDEVAEAAALGVDFCDVYLGAAPAWYVDACAPAHAMVAVGPDERLDDVEALPALGIAALEASCAPPEAYGTDLPLSRVAEVRALAARSDLPVIVPTQHAISVEDLPVLVRAGMHGLLIGAVVTGAQPHDVRAATERYASALRQLRS